MRLLHCILVTVLFIGRYQCKEVDEVDIEVANDDAGEEATVETVDDQYVTPSVPPGNGVYFTEHFDNVDEFKKKWIKSEAKKDGIDEEIAKYDGVWEVEPPEREALRGDQGLVLKSKAKHAAISARLVKPFVFSDKPFVVQYEVIHQNGQECGGAYIKLLTHDRQNSDLKKFHDKTPYTIMFGPDKCGNDYKLHFIFRHVNPSNGTVSEKHCKKPKERLDEPFTDKLPHLYTLIIRPDNTFQIYLDHRVVNEGSLLEDFSPPVNPPAEIDDPTDVRPADWDDREKIPDADARKPDDWDEDAPQYITDPSATKPAGWLDDEPENIPDPSAEKPSDWDEEMDGDWEAPLVPNPACEDAPGCGTWSPPQIPNPEYKGKWRPPLIDNPNYQGKWAPRRIPNPDFYEDRNPFKMAPVYAIGLELWSMSSQILFDNFIVTDDPNIADQWASQTFDLKKKKMDKEADSLVSAVVKYTNEHPWLWAIYVVVIGLPLVLVLVFCFGGPSSQEKEEMRRRGEAKKTDEPSPDDIPEEPEAEREVEDEVDENKGKEEKDENESTKEEPVTNEEEAAEGTTTTEEGGGDAPPSPRKRRSRKD